MKFTTSARWPGTTKRNKLRIGLLALAVVLCGTMLHAQTPDTSTLQGRVEDSNRQTIPGAAVTITNSLSGLSRTAETAAVRMEMASNPALGSASRSRKSQIN